MIFKSLNKFKNRGYKTLGAGKIFHGQTPLWLSTSQIEPNNWDFYYPSKYISHRYQIRAPREVIYPKEVENKSRPSYKDVKGENSWWTWGPIPVSDKKMSLMMHLITVGAGFINGLKKTYSGKK